jgi:XTP/dITP diphosphohydrolase
MWTESQLVLASHNTGKLKEFNALFASFGCEVLSQAALGVPSPEETGLTFIENALLKARHASQATGLPALADDSGLVVPALDGEPGLYSARYAGLSASDADNIERLLERLAGASDTDRRGYYICALALLRHANDPDPIIAIGTWHGELLHTPRGQGGFGYDPIFLPEGGEQTAAEMDPAIKNQISHRGKAVAHLLAQLQ